MGYYKNLEVNYIGDMPSSNAKGIVKIGDRTYEVQKKTMQKFKNYFGQEAIEALECFAISVLITHTVKNDGYFKLK